MTEIMTRSGRMVNVLDIKPVDICIEDIAWALAHQCRFNGHTRWFYSVAEHSIEVSRMCDNAKWGLLHDAAEAYIGDMVSPLKRFIPSFSRIENQILESVAIAYGLTPVASIPADVISADHEMVEVELECLVRNPRASSFECAPPEKAYSNFMERYHELWDEREAEDRSWLELGKLGRTTVVVDEASVVPKGSWVRYELDGAEYRQPDRGPIDIDVPSEN